MRMNDDRLAKMVMLEALEIGSKVKWVKKNGAEFGEVGVERIECGDIKWTGNKGSETTIEGFSVAESKSMQYGGRRQRGVQS